MILRDDLSSTWCFEWIGPGSLAAYEAEEVRNHYIGKREDFRLSSIAVGLFRRADQWRAGLCRDLSARGSSRHAGSTYPSGSRLLAKPGHWLVSKPAIKSIAALKGAKIGIQQFGGGDHYSAREILASGGVDPDKDVTFLQIGAGPTRLAALMAQAIDASPLTELETLKAQALNYSVLKFAGDVMELPLTGISTSLVKIEKQPQQVQRVVQSVLKGLQFVRQNKKGAAKIFADWLKLEPAQAEKAFDLLYNAFSVDGRASDEGFNRLVEMERKAGRVKGDIAISKLADWSFLKEVP